MIIAATLSGLSVGKLFLAGAIPGLLLGLGLMLVAYLIAKKKKYPKHHRSSLSQILKSFTNTFWALLMTFIILFGIVGGVFTPTEASVIAVIYALIIGIFVYKKLNFKNISVVILIPENYCISYGFDFANLFGLVLITEKPQRISNKFFMDIINTWFYY